MYIKFFKSSTHNLSAQRLSLDWARVRWVTARAQTLVTSRLFAEAVTQWPVVPPPPRGNVQADVIVDGEMLCGRIGRVLLVLLGNWEYDFLAK